MQRHISRALDCAASSARTILGKRCCRRAAGCVIEPLEIRRMLTVTFTPQYGIQATSNGGTVRTGTVPVELIFLGGSTGFGFDGSVTEPQIITAVNKILASSYLTGLSEYGTTSSASLDQTYDSNFNLTNGFSTSNLQSCVEDALNDGNGTLPEVDDPSNDAIYFVFTPSTVNSSQSNAIGYHTYGSTGGFLDPDNASFGWISSFQVFDTNRNINLDPIDSISSIFSHELAETLSNPQTTGGVTTVPTAAFQAAFATSFYQNPGEVADNEAQLYIGYEGDVAVQSLWSQSQNLFVIPGGTNQSFPLHGTSLIITGDQLGPTPQNDNLTISNIGGGIRVKLNSDTVDYGPGAVTDIEVKLLTGSNNVTIQSLPAGVTVNIDGAGGTTTLTGNTSPNTWHVTGTNFGNLNGVVNFTNIGTLTGGPGADNFDFFDGGSLFGSIDGAGGANTLDYSSASGPVGVDLNFDKASDITGHFSNIGNFVGSASSNDNLIGPDALWIINGANSGTVNGIPFSSFENLTGSILSDTFEFVTGGSISGNLDGGGGHNTLDYTSWSGPVTVNLASDTGPGIGGTFSNIDSIVGSNGSDMLIGPNAAATWTLTGSNSGSVNGTAFSSFENLTGGSGNDAFVFMPGGSVDGNIDGGGGSNTLDYSNLTTNVTINIGAHTATGIGGTWANINTFIGSQGTNTLAGSNADTTYTITGHNAIQVMGLTFGGFQSIVGGTGNDTFALQTGGSLDGSIDGGGGTNTLTYAAYTGNVIVNLQLHTATGVGGTITNIQNVVAGNGNDMIVGDANPNVLTGGTGRSILIGGGGADVLNGGLSDNILIGDGTIYDLNAAALMAIFNEWTRTDASFQQRVAHLISPGLNGLNGVYTLDKSAIILDNAADTINGSASTLDWFFDDRKIDTVTGFSPQDHTTGV